MIRLALDMLTAREPSAWLRKAEANVLVGVFARAFGVEPPNLRRLQANDALVAFREFTAACMEAALEDQGTARAYRKQLAACARNLGSRVRRLLSVRPEQAMRVTSYFYKGIDIRLQGELPGELRFGPCSFAQRYTPATCWFMSAFDEGFMRGISGTDAELAFSCRLTEGAPCCHAVFATSDLKEN